MRLRTLLATSSLAILPGTAFLAAPASAQEQYPPSVRTVVLGTSEVRAGEPLAVSGTGCPALAEVDVDFDRRGDTIGETQADQRGDFATTAVIPGTATPGSHTIIASCANLEFRTAVQVLGAQGSRGGRLPRTGAASTVPLGFAGAALVSVGLAAVATARRRRIGA